MNPAYITLTSVATSTNINLDYRQSPFNVSVAVTGSSSGTFGYTVQYTLDDLQWLAVIKSTRAAVWCDDANLVALSCNYTGNYMFPVAAVRLNCTAASSVLLTMCVLQGGPG